MMEYNDPVILAFVAIVLSLFAVHRFKERVTAFFGAAYPNARYSSMGNEFITRAGIGRVVTARNLQDAISATGSRDIGFKENEMDRLDRELDSLMSGVIEMVRSEMPAPTSPIFDVFLLRHEILTLKRILRAMHSGFEWHANPIGSLDNKTLQLLKEVEELQDLKYILRFTSYNELIADAYGEGVPELDEVDALLDNFLFDQLGKIVREIKVWKKPYLEYLHFYSDIENIKYAFRVRETEGELDEGSILASGTGIGEWELQQMAASDSFEEAVRHLQGTIYEIVAENIHVAQRELESKLLKLTGDLALRYINTAGPSLHFVQAREFEIGNLRKIFRGVNEGIPAREIEKELIIVD